MKLIKILEIFVRDEMLIDKMFSIFLSGHLLSTVIVFSVNVWPILFLAMHPTVLPLNSSDATKVKECLNCLNLCPAPL